MTYNLPTTLTFLAVAIAVLGLYSLVADLYFRDRALVKNRLDAEFRAHLREQAQRTALFKDLGSVAAEVALQGPRQLSYWQRFEELVQQSGLPYPARRVAEVSGGGALLLGLVVGGVRHSVVLGLLVVVVCLVGAVVFLQQRKKARLAKLLEQLPDALDLMARVIRTGQTVSQSLHAVAAEFEPPIASEFAFCYEQQNLGLSLPQALRDLSERNALAELKIFVIAMLVQQQTGGNLAEALAILAAVSRDRARLHGRIKALTAEGRLQAVTLMVLPPLMWFVLFILNRSYAVLLFERPSMILFALVLMGLGALWIRNITQIEV